MAADNAAVSIKGKWLIALDSVSGELVIPTELLQLNFGIAACGGLALLAICLLTLRNSTAERFLPLRLALFLLVALLTSTIDSPRFRSCIAVRNDAVDWQVDADAIVDVPSPHTVRKRLPITSFSSAPPVLWIGDCPSFAALLRGPPTT